MRLPAAPTATAPDGSDVRVLLATERGSCAHFELAGGEISTAVVHRTIDEIWFFLSGRGQMWRKQGSESSIIAVQSGVCVTIPLGTAFQFRSFDEGPLAAIAVTMPPWPGGDEAVLVAGEWDLTAGE